MEVFAAGAPISVVDKAVGIAAVLAVATGVLVLVYGLGATLCPRRLSGRAERFGLGFLFLGMTMAAAGAVGALQLPLLLTLFVPMALFGLVRRKGPRACQAPFGVLGAFALVLITLRLLSALLPQTHGDALYYHLPSAMAWAKAERIHFIEWLPFSLQGGIAEYLYALIAMLLPEPMALQIAGQLMHAFWGFALTGFVVRRIARHWLTDSWSWVAALGFLTMSAQGGLLVTAKNDGYVLALAMLSLLQVSECFRRQDHTREFLAYAFASGAFAVKHTAAFYLIPFVGVFWIFQALVQREGAGAVFLRHAAFGLMSAPLALPALARNYAFTGNPMFPAMDEYFRSPYMNDVLRAYMKTFSHYPGSLWTILSTQTARLWGSKIFYWLGFGALRGAPPMARFLWALLVLAFLLLVVVTGRGEYARFHYYLYAVLSLLAATGAQNIWGRLAAGWRQRVFVAFVGISILAGSAVEVSAQAVGRLLPWLASNQSYLAYFDKVKPVFAMHQWMNAELSDARIFSFAENEVLYLDHPLVVPENHRGANEILAASSFSQAVAALRKGGYTHILIPPDKLAYFPVLTDAPAFADEFILRHEVNGYRVYGWKNPD